MVITISPSVPCAQCVASTTAVCGRPATHGILSPAVGKVWELLPVCAEHLYEELLDFTKLSNKLSTGNDVN